MRQRRRGAILLGALSTAAGVLALIGAPAAAPASAAATLPAGCTQKGLALTCERSGINRVHLVDGKDVPVEASDRTVSVTIEQAFSLRDRQGVVVTWSGAHPTGGTVNDPTSIAASEQEYPMLLMQCRGLDSPDAPEGQRLSPRTCWTQSPGERAGSTSTFLFPPFRNDRYADPLDRQRLVGLPDKDGIITTDPAAVALPDACSGADAGAQHWVPFDAADGARYLGGPSGCAGMAPEAANASSSLQPSNTTYGVTRIDGTGDTVFVINSAESNASLGCSDTVPCSLVAVPIMGIACDIAGAALPRVDRVPRAQLDKATQQCTATGHYQPGSDSGGTVGVEDPAVSGLYWWSESNWRNRITIPLGFSQPSNVCDLVNTSKPSYIYGSQMLGQATLQWGPRFCLDKSLFKVQHVQFSEPGARNLLNSGGIEAAVVGAPPKDPWAKPTVQAPLAVTGFAVAFRLDDHHHREVVDVKLTPRLLAKLLTMSYPALVGLRDEMGNAGDRSTPYYDAKSIYYDAHHADYLAMAHNPLDIIADPEFRALNPGMMEYTDGYDSTSASTLFSLSSDSDVIFALTSYLNADPEAREWLSGVPDPWGMRVNPRYKGISLPTYAWPVNDTYKSEAATRNNPCLDGDKNVPILPLIAAPVSNPSTVTLNMQFGIANSQVVCKDAGQPNQKLVSLGRQPIGARALFGLVPLADAVRFLLPTASLQTSVAADAPSHFDDSTGRQFAAPTNATLTAAVKLLKPDTAVGTWPIPYAAMRSSATAYPGTMLLSLAVPTSGLPKADALRYARLIRILTTSGQKPGVGNGQLPAGFLPMTAAHGAAALLAYDVRAAAAVQAQQGFVPGVDGSGTPPSTPTPTPTPSSTPSTDSGGDTYDSGSEPTVEPTSEGGSTAATSAPSPSTTASPAPAAKPTPTETLSAGLTPKLTDAGGLPYLPLVLGVALLAGLGAVVLAFWGRW